MKAFVPKKSDYQKLKEFYDEKLKELVKLEHSEAINLAIVTRIAADVDSGLAESTILKNTKRWKSYIDSVHSGNVTLQEIIDTLEKENGLDFSWMKGN